jgi:hypothetical protein
MIVAPPRWTPNNGFQATAARQDPGDFDAW